MLVGLALTLIECDCDMSLGATGVKICDAGTMHFPLAVKGNVAIFGPPV